MRKIRKFRSAAITLLVVGAAVACQPGEKGLSAADRSSIEDVTRRFENAIRSKDWAGVAALYTDDTIFNPPNAPAIEGRAAVEAWMANFPPLNAFSLEPVKVEGSGDLAYVLGRYTMTLAPPGAPEPIHDHGKFIEIRRRQPNGEWLISADIFNSDLPSGGQK